MLNRKFYYIRCELPSVHVTSKHIPIKKKELRLSFCGRPISSTEIQALQDSGTTFSSQTPPMFGKQTRIFFLIRQ